MDCPSCGAECAGGARFCWSCGQTLRGLSEERRVVTVVFADLVGFTTLSEHLDPEQVKRIVDLAFERLVRDVTAFGGRVDKIIGDAIVALFGAPVAHEDDAERAVRAALRMQDTLAAYAEESGVDIRMRIGVNTGEVLVGALRAGGDYTAMGDVVNTASRLQTLADPGEVLVGETTHTATEEVIAYESRGSLIARGRGQPVNVWSARTALLPPGYRTRSRLSPLVGREAELSILTNAVRVSIRHGRAQLITIFGEAGVGKTRLANELASLVAEEDDVVVHSGRCVPYGEANPWWPVAEALRSGCGVAAEDPLDAARARITEVAARVGVGDTAVEVEAVVNGLLHFMGYEGPLRGLDGSRARAEATQALLTFLEAVLREGPLLVRLADLHWADDAVLDLVDELLSPLARFPLVLIGTSRRALQERWTPRAGRFNSLVLNLDPLDRAASTQLLESLVGEGLDATTRSLLLDRSGGNPFYLEELATLLGQQSAGAVVTGTGPGPSLPEGLPDTLRGLVAARIDGLSPEEQQVLEDAAVWGSSGPLMVVNRLAEAVRGVADVSGLVQSLADKDVLVFDGKGWSFRSDLVREVAYARLTKRERLLRHAGIATYLENAAAGRLADDALVDTVARHYAEAAHLAQDLGAPASPPDLPRRAVRWTAEAARRAEDGASWPTATRLYGQALDLLGQEVSGERFRCLLGRSRARSEQWDDAGAREDGLVALKLAESLDDPSARAQSLVRLGVSDLRCGEWTRADQELGEALELFDAQGDVRGRAEALRQRGMAFLLRGDQRSAEQPIAAALDAFRAVGDRRGEAWALQNLAWIAFSDGRVEVAERHIEASEQAFTEVGDRGGLAWAQGLLAFVKAQQGDFERAREISARIMRECERRGDRFGQAMMHLVQAGVELWTGHAASAVAAADHAVDFFRSAGPALTGEAVGLEQALALAGRARVMAGEVAAGLELIDESVRVSAETSTTFGTAVRLLTLVQLGRPEALGPTDELAEAGGPVTTAVSQLAAARALALAQLSREEEALVLAREAAGTATAGGYETAALAVVAAACGAAEEAAAAAAGVVASEGATYLDRITALLAVAMVDHGPAGERALAEAQQATGVGEDRVAVALVALAGAVRAEVQGRVDAPERSRAEQQLAALGMEHTRWRDVFRRAAGRLSPT